MTIYGQFSLYRFGWIQYSSLTDMDSALEPSNSVIKRLLWWSFMMWSQLIINDIYDAIKYLHHLYQKGSDLHYKAGLDLNEETNFLFFSWLLVKYDTNVICRDCDALQVSHLSCTLPTAFVLIGKWMSENQVYISYFIYCTIMLISKVKNIWTLFFNKQRYRIKNVTNIQLDWREPSFHETSCDFA